MTTDNLVIRKAKVSDLSALQKLSSDLIVSDSKFDKLLRKEWSFEKDGKEYLLRRIRGRKGVCFVAEINGDIVGYVTGGILPVQKWRPVKRSEMDNLYIKEKYRGNKMGAKLMDRYLEWSKQKGMEKVLLYVASENESAIGFYKHNAFVPEHLTMEVAL